MNITIENSKITIPKNDISLINLITKALSYSDKSKKYRIQKLKKLAKKNPFLAPKLEITIKELQKDSEGCLVKDFDHHIEIPSGFFYLISNLSKKFDINILDKREENGLEISLPWVNKPDFELRPYQEEAVEIILNNKRSTISIATGMGKSFVAVNAIKKYKRKSLIICPTESIANQFHNDLCKYFGSEKVGFLGKGKKKIKHITVGIASSINRNLDMLANENIGFTVFDECLSGNMSVVTNKGPIKLRELYVDFNNIDDLMAWSYNENTSTFEWKKIKNVLRKRPDRRILQIKTYNCSNIICTENHKILTTNGWKEAGNLVLSDKIICFPSEYGRQQFRIKKEFGPNQEQIVLGSILGDGTIGISDNSSRLGFCNGDKQIDYFNWKTLFFDINDRDISKNTNWNGQKVINRFITKSRSSLNKFINQKKNLDIELFYPLNELGLAIWYCDDGSFNGNGSSLHTENFNYENQLKLKELLYKKFNLDAQIKYYFYKKRNKGYYHLYFNRRETDKLHSLIYKFVHPSMRYKLFPKYRELNFEDIAHPDYLKYGLANIKEIKCPDFSQKWVRDKMCCQYVYDIEVEDNHNFVLDSGHVVHNCQHLPSNTFSNICDKLSNVGKMCALSATPYRTDGKDIFINAACGEILINKDAKWGIENGYLAKPYFLVRLVNTQGKDNPDDKLKNYKNHILNNKVMKAQIEEDANKMIKAGKKVLILVDQIEHGEELSKNLGIPFANGLDKNSQKYIDDMNSGKISALIGGESKIGEGTDIKSIEVLIMANFPASKGLVTQCIGRSLRLAKGKDKALILDYIPMGSEQLKRHGFIRVNIYKEITSNVKVV